MTITFEDGYGYALLCRDSCALEISENVDYIKMRPFESAYVGLLIKPESPDTVYVVKGFEEPLINQKALSFVRIESEDPLYFDKIKVPGSSIAYFSKPIYFEIAIGDRMDSVVYFETRNGYGGIVAEPYD